MSYTFIKKGPYHPQYMQIMSIMLSVKVGT